MARVKAEVFETKDKATGETKEVPRLLRTYKSVQGMEGRCRYHSENGWVWRDYRRTLR